MDERRHDIDWLRVLAIGFLVIYHVAIPFQPWGVFLGFIKSPESLETIWIPMSFLNVWRIPLLFFVSGMGVCFSMKKRNWKALFKERTLRILVPLLAGSLLIVPLQNIIWQLYYNQDLTPVIFPAHLWFLGNIFTYVLLLAPLLFYLKKREAELKPVVARWLNHPMKLLLISLPFIGSVLLIAPETYAMYAYTLHGYVLGLLAFFFGFLFVYAGIAVWHTLRRWKWAFLAVGTILFTIRWLHYDLESPLYLMSVETIIWIYTILGLANTYLNFSNRYLPYLTEAAYPVYIVHWLFIHLAGYWLFPLNLSPWINLVGVTVITFAGSVGFYHLVLRRINFLRPLFGLKLRRKSERKSGMPSIYHVKTAE